MAEHTHPEWTQDQRIVAGLVEQALTGSRVTRVERDGDTWVVEHSMWGGTAGRIVVNHADVKAHL